MPPLAGPTNELPRGQERCYELAVAMLESTFKPASWARVQIPKEQKAAYGLRDCTIDRAQW